MSTSQEKYTQPQYEVSWDDDLFTVSAINLANKNFKLSSFFKERKINFINTYHSKGWSKKRKCPFPDHNETTPSFYFNQEDEIFHCFGCNRGGKIVQFISFLEKRNQLEVANSLLKGIDLKDLSFDIEYVSEDENIKKTLFDFFDYYYDWISLNKSKKNLAENLMFVFECYLKNNFKKNISLQELNARISFLKNKLREFECLEK